MLGLTIRNSISSILYKDLNDVSSGMETHQKFQIENIYFTINLTLLFGLQVACVLSVSVSS